ncbi:MAG TPA: hypothetical protein VK896_02615 [Gaiellaceae bacterium]|nr:hypothetical protein [Gaiellaceae bacterium]
MRTKGRSRSAVAALAVAVAAVAAVAPSAWAGKPQIERFDINESVPDEFFSDACGVDVTAHAHGHVIVRGFDRQKGVVELRTLNIAVTLTANGNSYSFRDVGADQVKVTRDGAILSIIGQIPVEGFNGVLKINLDTGEVVHEPSPVHFVSVEEICAALTA